MCAIVREAITFLQKVWNFRKQNCIIIKEVKERDNQKNCSNPFPQRSFSFIPVSGRSVGSFQSNKNVFYFRHVQRVNPQIHFVNVNGWFWQFYWIRYVL